MAEDPTETIREWRDRMLAAAGAGPAIAERLAGIVRTEIDREPTEQRSVSGEAWKPRKMTGRRGKPRADALAKGERVVVNAAEAVTVKAIGNVVVVRVDGPEVIHHFKGRPLLPLGNVKRLGDAIRFGIVDMGEEFLTRKGRHDKGAKGQKWNPRMGGTV